MKKILFTGAAMLLVASAAFAGGIDLSVGACPGNAGSVGGETGAVDCTADPGNELAVVVLATWAANEALTDLVGLDGLLEMQVQPDLDAGGFWNVDPAGCGAAGMNSSQVRPAGCTTPAYNNLWSPAGSGTAIAAIRRGPAVQRMAFTVFRPTLATVAANARLFGAQIMFNAGGDLAGACPGCSNTVAMVFNSGKPGTAGSPATELNNSTGLSAGFSNCVGFNGGAANCLAVPTKKRTWGQLKSLYR
jgi:hypothetical protein